MQTHYPAFHGEYWVYVLASAVIITFGSFYIV
jgi:hypothetical protein